MKRVKVLLCFLSRQGSVRDATVTVLEERGLLELTQVGVIDGSNTRTTWESLVEQ